MKPMIRTIFVCLVFGAGLGLYPACARTVPGGNRVPATSATLQSFGPAGLGGDDTAVFQRAINATSKSGQVLNVELSRSPYRVGPLYLPSNANLHISRGVIIQTLPGYSDGQKLITIGDVQNVHITGYGSTLKMNRPEY